MENENTLTVNSIADVTPSSSSLCSSPSPWPPRPCRLAGRRSSSPRSHQTASTCQSSFAALPGPSGTPPSPRSTRRDGHRPHRQAQSPGNHRRSSSWLNSGPIPCTRSFATPLRTRSTHSQLVSSLPDTPSTVSSSLPSAEPPSPAAAIRRHRSTARCSSSPAFPQPPHAPLVLSRNRFHRP